MEKASKREVVTRATAISVAPDRTLVRLTYADQITLSTTSLGYASHFFRLNSVYDPDFTATGHQPTGFDEWAAFYNYYRVMKVKGEVEIGDGSSAAGSSCVFSIKPTQSTTGSTTVSEILEDQRASGTLYNPTGPPRKLSFEWDIRTLFGVSKGFYDQSTYAALTSANPFDQVFLEMQARSAGTGTTYYCLVRFDYFVEFYERNEVAPSLMNQAMRFIREKEGVLNSKASSRNTGEKEARHVQPIQVVQQRNSDTDTQNGGGWFRRQ